MAKFGPMHNKSHCATVFITITLSVTLLSTGTQNPLNSRLSLHAVVLFYHKLLGLDSKEDLDS